MFFYLLHAEVSMAMPQLLTDIENVDNTSASTQNNVLKHLRNLVDDKNPEKSRQKIMNMSDDTINRHLKRLNSITDLSEKDEVTKNQLTRVFLLEQDNREKQDQLRGRVEELKKEDPEADVDSLGLDYLYEDKNDIQSENGSDNQDNESKSEEEAPEDSKKDADNGDNKDQDNAQDDQTNDSDQNQTDSDETPQTEQNTQPSSNDNVSPQDAGEELTANQQALANTGTGFADMIVKDLKQQLADSTPGSESEQSDNVSDNGVKHPTEVQQDRYDVDDSEPSAGDDDQKNAAPTAIAKNRDNEPDDSVDNSVQAPETEQMDINPDRKTLTVQTPTVTNNTSQPQEQRADPEVAPQQADAYEAPQNNVVQVPTVQTVQTAEEPQQIQATISQAGAMPQVMADHLMPQQPTVEVANVDNQQPAQLLTPQQIMPQPNQQQQFEQAPSYDGQQNFDAPQPQSSSGNEDDLRQRNEELEQKLDQQQQNALQQQQELVSNFQQQQQAQMQQFQQQQMDQMQQQNQMAQQHADELKSAQDEARRREADIRSQHDDELSELKNQHKAQKEALESSHQEELDKKKQQNEEKKQKMKEKHAEKVGKLKQKIEEEQVTNQDQAQQHKEELEKAETDHAEQVKDLDQKHKDELKTTQLAHAQASQQMEETHKKEIEDKAKQHDEALAQHKKEAAEKEANLHKKHEQEKNELHQEHEKKNEALKNNHTHALDAKYHADKHKIEQEHKAEKERLEKEHEKELQGKSHEEQEKLKHHHKEAIDKLEKQHKEKIDQHEAHYKKAKEAVDHYVTGAHHHNVGHVEQEVTPKEPAKATHAEGVPDVIQQQTATASAASSHTDQSKAPHEAPAKTTHKTHATAHMQEQTAIASANINQHKRELQDLKNRHAQEKAALQKSKEEKLESLHGKPRRNVRKAFAKRFRKLATKHNNELSHHHARHAFNKWRGKVKK